MGLDWDEWGEWWGVCFLHKLCETQLPEFDGNELASFEVPRVAGGLMVVTTGKDGAMERIFWGNINMAFVCQDVVIIFPV